MSSAPFKIASGLALAAVLLSAGLAPNSAHAQATCVAAPTGLVSWWRGEGTGYDSAGKNHGTLQGGITFASGKVGQAFSLDGVNDSVDLGPRMNLQIFTIAMWVKPAASQVQFADIMDNNHTGSRSWVIQQDGRSVPHRYGWGTAVFSLAADTWQYLVVTREADGVRRVYVNGELAASAPASGAILYDGSQYVRLGRWGGGGRYWNGLMDEVDIYAAALQASDVQALYAASAGKCPPSPTAPPAPPANPVYVNDFETGNTTGWSSSAIETTPSARKFLGQFSTGNNAINLTLSGLPTHTNLTVAFDLYVIRSWDGNHNAGGCCGPDAFEVRADGVVNPLLLHTTFSNDHPFTRSAGQAYPGPDPAYPPRTGATEVNTLGYTFADQFIPSPIPMDSVYRLQIAFPHTAGSVTLSFSSTLAQGLGDESWGLDNVGVGIIPPPNQSPTAQAAGPYTVDEGASIALTGSGTDPEGSTLTYAWDLDGDGAFETAGATPTFSAVSLDGPANRGVTLRVCDDRSGCATDTATVTVLNVKPTVTVTTPMAESTYATDSQVNLTAIFTDPGRADSHSCVIDWGDGSPAVAGTVDPVAQTCMNAHSFSAAGVKTIRVTVADDDGSSDTAPVTVRINTPPVALAGGPYSVPEGGSVVLSGSGTDRDAGDTLTYSWNLDGDGTFETPSQGTVFSANSLDGPTSRTVTLQVCDSHGACSTSSAVVNVLNVAPTITSFSITDSLAGPLVVAPSVVTVVFADPASQDTWSAAFTYSDGAPATQTVTPFQSGQSVTHQFATAGCNKLISARVTDDDSGPGSATATVNVGTAAFLAPLTNAPATDTLKNNRVLPVQVRIADCAGAVLTNLSPAIRLVEGDLTPQSDDGTDVVVPPTVSAADTTGVMRFGVDCGCYRYNMQVNLPKLNTDYTIVIYPYGTVGDTPPTLRHVIQATK
jgi:hypothetical protein